MTEPLHPSHADILNAVNLIQLTLQRVETGLKDLKEAVGTEGTDDRGQPIGTGVRGRLGRLEGRVDKRFRTFDDWRNYAMGAMAASLLLVTAIWWIVQDRVGHLLK